MQPPVASSRFEQLHWRVGQPNSFLGFRGIRLGKSPGSCGHVSLDRVWRQCERELLQQHKLHTR